MRVAKLIEPEKIVVTDEQKSEQYEDNEVIVKVKACGLCGTDLHIFSQGRADVVLPRVMGHELSGEVIKIGEGVSNVKPGDRVVLDPVVACGECYVCNNGHENVCANVKCFGVQMDGGFQDYIKVDAKRLYKVPDNMTWEEAALVETYSIAANIIGKARVVDGEIVVVFGAGPIGLALVQSLKGIDAKVIVSDIIDSRLEIAKEFGADKVVNSMNEDIAKEIESYCVNGADVIIDAVGNSKLFAQAVEMARPISRIVEIGFDGNGSNIKPIDITKKELEILGSRMNCNKFSKVIQWYKEGVINPQKMISEIYDFNDIQKAFVDVTTNPKDYIKVVLRY